MFTYQNSEVVIHQTSIRKNGNHTSQLLNKRLKCFAPKKKLKVHRQFETAVPSPVWNGRFKQQQNSINNLRKQLTLSYYSTSLAVSGPAQCNECFGSNATSCNKNQKNETCATDRDSLGTTHCGSAKGTSREHDGNVTSDFFIRGCINCAGKYSTVQN